MDFLSPLRNRFRAPHEFRGSGCRAHARRTFRPTVELLEDRTVPSITVPGRADPWLAGMPAGTISGGDSRDSAPDESPVLVTGLTLVPGAPLTFSATGSVRRDPTFPFQPPDGKSTEFSNVLVGETRYGISNIFAPMESLLGVFLADNPPNPSATPGTLDFRAGGNVSGGVDYLTLSPTLQQVFFIGDGRTSGNVLQRVIVPAGATRLFLGTMDSSGWFNNGGSFQVTVPAVAIDIKPDTTINSINLANGGVIPVTIFGSATFDVTQVDVTSVVFAGAHAAQFTLEDVNGDGFQDLSLQFRTQDTNLLAVYEALLAAADTNKNGVLDPNVSTHQTITLTLAGRTNAGLQFQGFDQADLFLAGSALQDFLALLASRGEI
jgi:hypothetical protein